MCFYVHTHTHTHTYTHTHTHTHTHTPQMDFGGLLGMFNVRTSLLFPLSLFLHPLIQLTPLSPSAAHTGSFVFPLAHPSLFLAQHVSRITLSSLASTAGLTAVALPLSTWRRHYACLQTLPHLPHLTPHFFHFFFQSVFY